jgi:hypothetical protein
MRVIDNDTHEVVGYLSDVSQGGFRVDSQKPLKVNKDYALRLDETSEISDKSFIAFIARAMWKQPDPIDPNAQNEGFQIVSISPYDQEIYQRVVDKYGVTENIM